jgi:hypothetical protein
VSGLLLLPLEDLKCFQPPSQAADPTMTPPLPGINTYAAPFGIAMSAAFARAYGSQRDNLLLLLLLLLLTSRMLLRAKPPFSPGSTILIRKPEPLGSLQTPAGRRAERTSRESLQ